MTLLTRIFVIIALLVMVVKAQDGLLGQGGQPVEDANGHKSVPLRTHSLYPPYLDSDLQSRW